MKITRINGIYEIELSKKEYLEICEKENEMLDFYNQYDLEEIENIIDDYIIINENMLDECEDGFFMWRDTFERLIIDYPGVPKDIRTDISSHLDYDERRKQLWL